MPTPSRSVRRDGPDACPGVRSVWSAADGGLARVRIPGGRLAVRDLRVLADAAEELGTGVLELTSRANVQVRGLRPAGEHELAARLRIAGLLPSETHDRVRNIVASPLSGLLDRPDVMPVVAALDDELCADPGLAGLPGRFLFAVDDGSRDVVSLEADITLVATGDVFELHLGGSPVGMSAEPVAAALGAAHGFLDERGVQCSPAWRLTELAEGPARVASRLGPLFLYEQRTADPADSAAQVGLRSCMSSELLRPGMYRQADARIALVLDAGDGRLAAAAFRALADVAHGEVRVTPWRGVVLPSLDPDAVGTVTAALAPHGLRTERQA